MIKRPALHQKAPRHLLGWTAAGLAAVQVLTALVDALTEFVDSLAGLVDSAVEIVGSIAGVVDALAPVLVPALGG
jgi:phage-related minor tail protein